MTFFGLNQTGKVVFTKELFNLEILHNAITLYLHETFQRHSEHLKKIQTLKFPGDSNKRKNKKESIYSISHVQNLQNNIYKSSKIGQDKKLWYLFWCKYDQWNRSSISRKKTEY